MARKLGVSWSWRRATGLSAAKGKISRAIGVPLTKGGRQRKAGATLGGLLSLPFLMLAGRRASVVTAEVKPGLVRCPGCDGTISTRAESCPRCGCEFAEDEEARPDLISSLAKYGLLGLAALLALGYLVSLASRP